MIPKLPLFAVAFSVQLLPITIDILFLKRGTKSGAIIGLALGLGFAFAFTTLFPLVVGQDSLLLSYINQAKAVLPVHAAAWGLAANILGFVLVSLLQRPARNNT